MFLSCRSLSPNAVTDPSSFVRSSSHTSFDTHSLPRRPQKGRVSALEDDPTKVQYCHKCLFIELTVIVITMSDAGIKNLWSFSSIPPLCLRGVYLGTIVLYLCLIQGGSCLCQLVMAACFMVTGALLAVKHIRILPANQHA
jgi:hypothetical protein